MLSTSANILLRSSQQHTHWFSSRKEKMETKGELTNRVTRLAIIYFITIYLSFCGRLDYVTYHSFLMIVWRMYKPDIRLGRASAQRF